MRKTTRIMVIFLLALFSITAFAYQPNPSMLMQAADCCALPTRFLNDGVYMGLGLGYDNYRIRENFSIADALGNPVFGAPGISAKGINGSILLGYGRYFSWFYIAGEATTTYTQAKQHTLFQSAALTYQTDNNVRISFNASLLPGIKLTEAALIYMRLGVVRTFLQTNEYGTSAAPYGTTHTDWYNGINYGIGLETAISTHLGLREEYTHAAYDASTSILGTKFSLMDNQWMVSLLYHFG